MQKQPAAEPIAEKRSGKAIPGELPEITTLREALTSLKSARRSIFETRKEHDALAEKLETLIQSANLADPSVSAEFSAIKNAIELFAIRNQKVTSELVLMEASINMAIPEAAKAVCRKCMQYREDLIHRLTDVFARHYSKRTAAKLVAAGSDDAEALRWLSLLVSTNGKNAGEFGAQSVIANADELAAIEARNSGVL